MTIFGLEIVLEVLEAEEVELSTVEVPLEVRRPRVVESSCRFRLVFDFSICPFAPYCCPPTSLLLSPVLD